MATAALATEAAAAAETEDAGAVAAVQWSLICSFQMRLFIDARKL